MTPRALLVLVVDDFADARELYEATLTHEGFRVITAVDAISGITLAREQQPDLILMDAGLPGMTGWDAVGLLKADPRTLAIPVLIFTGHVLQGARAEAVRAGADGFIPKPCLPDELARHIRRVRPGRFYNGQGRD